MAPTSHKQDWPAPYIDNVAEGEEVYNRLLLATGRCGPVDRQFDGHIYVEADYASGAPTLAGQTWPVSDSHFKALVPLSPGSNTLRFTFLAPPELHASASSERVTTLRVNYAPLTQNPPLHLVILHASDSPLTIDCPPELRAEHANLDAVVAKMQMWAYMSQAFTAEQCRRNGLGRRTFALDEKDGQKDTLERYNSHSAGGRTAGRAPKVHLLRSSHSLREFRDPDVAQQNPRAKRAQALHQWATEALNSPNAPQEFHSPNGSYVAVLLLDAHWDPQQKLLLGHAALGAGGPVSRDPKVGVFGSHSCWSWPRSLGEVVDSLLDCKEVDERYVVNDLGNVGTAWETLNVGHGAFLHECGHALNNPHHATGIMARGYHEWNRSFMVREAHSKRTNTSSCRCITPAIDCRENHWNRMSLLRLRYHPTMRLPNDPFIPYHYTAVAPAFSVTKDGIAVFAPVGLGSLEVQVDGRYVHHIEFPFAGPNPQAPPQNLRFTSSDIKELAKISDGLEKHKITLTAVGTDQRQAEIEDYGALSRGSRLVIQVTPEGPQKPVPTGTSSAGGAQATVGPTHAGGSSGSKFFSKLDKFANKHGLGNLTAGMPIPGGAQGKVLHGQTSATGPGQIEVIKGIHVGQEKAENTWLVVLNSHQGNRPKLVKIEIVSGLALDGFRLFYEDGSRQAVGPCSGGGSRSFTVSPPGKITKLTMRAGAWCDAVSISHTHGETGLCGGGGGDIRVLAAPEGSEICGFFGSSGQWMNSLGLLYTAT